MIINDHKLMIINVQILSMIEEAAGTRMYESKRSSAQKTIEKKDTKLSEIDKVTSLSPSLSLLCMLLLFMSLFRFSLMKLRQL